jgi:BAG domain
VLNLIPTVSVYKIRSGGTLLLLDSTPAASPSPAAAVAPKPQRTEASTIELIQSEIANIRGTLEPSVDTFLRTPTVDAEHTRLGELLLQALLRLDAISIDSTWTEARRERKSAVRAVQGVLDRLDKGWREAKAQAQTSTGSEPRR